MPIPISRLSLDEGREYGVGVGREVVAGSACGHGSRRGIWNARSYPGLLCYFNAELDRGLERMRKFLELFIETSSLTKGRASGSLSAVFGF